MQASQSGKMQVLFRIIVASQAAQEPVILFSQSIRTLNVIERILMAHNSWMNENSKTMKASPNASKKKASIEASRNIRYLRIDGSTSLQKRHQHIKAFYSGTHDVFLVSTRAGGEGVNLTAGTRIVLYDVSWNPSHDQQAMCRSFRFGQTKPVHVYRLIGRETMEHTVFKKQVRKESIAMKVVDTPLKRHQTWNDIQVYFDIQKFKKGDPRDSSIDSVPGRYILNKTHISKISSS